MSITELVFITVQPDPQVRKELNMKLPDALRGVFSGLPKLESLYIASNFGLLGEDGGSHDDICLLLSKFGPRHHKKEKLTSPEQNGKIFRALIPSLSQQTSLHSKDPYCHTLLVQLISSCMNR